MIVLLALLLASVFGGADQYLGSLSAYPWAADVSLLSAPWLVLAFVAGCTQRDPKRAALLGFACTAAALLGYGLMTLSPIEGAHLTQRSVIGFVGSESRIVVGSVLTGPLFGWIGSRWRTDRAWPGAALAGAVLCLEPLAHASIGNTIRHESVWLAEVAVGVAILIYVALARRTSFNATPG